MSQILKFIFTMYITLVCYLLFISLSLSSHCCCLIFHFPALFSDQLLLVMSS